MPGNMPSTDPDSSAKFLSHHDRWVSLRQKAISEFVSKINSFSDFDDTYKFLEQKRQDIAVELMKDANGEVQVKAYEYGQRRRDRGGTYETDEIFSSNPDVTFWKRQSSAVIQRVRSLCSSDQEDGNRYFRLHSNIAEDGLGTLEILQRPPGELIGVGKYSVTLTTFYYERDEDGVEHCRLLYRSPNKYDTPGDIKIAGYLYRQCLDWNPTQGTEALIKNVGILYHRLSHFLLSEKGTAAILEFLVEGIFLSKRLDVQPKMDNPLCWNLEALVTPDPDVFAQWFQDKAVTVRSLPSGEDRPPSESFFSDTSYSNDVEGTAAGDHSALRGKPKLGRS
ncbi:MAG: hypothetical protein CMF50_06755 [Legionellales bacterium]|nr:hypothetical protein [Legionellales bacterium]|tara:strand:+ start:33279 stop:34286 length:1008 start_codon:yes stop_codon:yes gene_type:complete